MRLGHLGQMHFLDFLASGVRFFTRLQGVVNHMSASSATPFPIPSSEFSASANKETAYSQPARKGACSSPGPAQGSVSMLAYLVGGHQHRACPLTPCPPAAHNTRFGDKNNEMPGDQGAAGEGRGRPGDPSGEFQGTHLLPFPEAPLGRARPRCRGSRDVQARVDTQSDAVTDFMVKSKKS